MKRFQLILVCAALWLTFGAAAEPALDATSQVPSATAPIMPTSAVAPASTASIEELLQVTHADSLTNTMNAEMEQQVRLGITKALKDEHLTPAQHRALDQYLPKAVALIREGIIWSKLKPEMIQIYRNVYTQNEVDGMIVFYRSPVGQATIEKMPQLMQQAMRLNMDKMSILMPKLMAELKASLAQAKDAP